MKKILFTSDLDRTLIFSERTKLADRAYMCIEQLDGKDLSYMSRVTYDRLMDLAQQIEFVPVTTRSQAQYERITAFQQHQINPTYAVTSNGGVILRNGVVDEEWKQQIEQKMQQLPLSFEQVPTHFATLFEAAFTLRTHAVENRFYVVIVQPEKVSPEHVRAMKVQLEAQGWTCYLQGKKWYVLPRFLTKGAAVQHIKSLHSYEWHAAAGDSQMDLSMLEIAHKSFIPQHAELANPNVVTHRLPIMVEKSSDFSEACLQYIATYSTK